MAISRLVSSGLYDVSTGLVGAGNWASVTATTGSPTTGTYADANGVAWKYYQWTGNGSVTLTAGLVDTFMISGGGPGWNYPGAGGRVRDGIIIFSTGTHTVTIGTGASGDPTGSGIGLPSSVGSINTGSASQFVSSGTTSTATRNSQYTNSITGTALTYGRRGIDGTRRANRGDGGWAGDNSAGSSGVVIIRVPTQFAIA
jgi:hypothetical protein